VKFQDALRLQAFLRDFASEHGETRESRECVGIVEREIAMLQERATTYRQNIARKGGVA
jgi:hypothetical protein